MRGAIVLSVQVERSSGQLARSRHQQQQLPSPAAQNQLPVTSRWPQHTVNSLSSIIDAASSLVCGHCARLCHFVNWLVELVACVVNNKKLLSLPRTLRGLGLLDSGSVHQGSDWAHTLTLSGRAVGPIVFLLCVCFQAYYRRE